MDAPSEQFTLDSGSISHHSTYVALQLSTVRQPIPTHAAWATNTTTEYGVHVTLAYLADMGDI